jgi:hypothetical protein
MLMKLTRVALLAGVMAAGLLALAGPASAATTYPISGRQTVVDENAGTAKMRGGLIGDWATTSFNVKTLSPIFTADGTEHFAGCLNRRRDRSCHGDPKGTLDFTFTAWALYGSADPSSLIWGGCLHPVVSGTGGFAGAKGIVVMTDIPTPKGVRTRYIGSITLPGGASSRRGRGAHAARAAAAPGC